MHGARLLMAALHSGQVECLHRLHGEALVCAVKFRACVSSGLHRQWFEGFTVCSSQVVGLIMDCWLQGGVQESAQ